MVRILRDVENWVVSSQPPSPSKVWCIAQDRCADTSQRSNLNFPYPLKPFSFLFFFFGGIGNEPRVLCLLGKLSSQPHPSSGFELPSDSQPGAVSALSVLKLQVWFFWTVLRAVFVGLGPGFGFCRVGMGPHISPTKTDCQVSRGGACLCQDKHASQASSAPTGIF